MNDFTPLSSNFKSQEAYYTELWKETKQKVIGPMPVRSFLDAFLPALVSPGQLGDPVEGDLETLRSVEEELSMYEAFIKVFEEPVKSHLTFWDTHDTEMKDMSGIVIKPDVCIVDDESREFVGRQNHTLKLDSVGITVEMKYNSYDNPFTNNPSEDFQKTTPTARHTFGQLCAYAAAHMASQFRTHVFSILVLPDGARLLRWDRAGVIVTDIISFSSPQAARPMSEFFLRYALADDAQRGVDTSAKRLSPGEIDSLPCNIWKSIQGADPASVYRFSFPPRNQDEEAKTYVAEAPYYMGTPFPTGRATRGFKACCERTGKVVFLKDTWRVLGEDLIAEHETYAKLTAKKVTHVATVLDYCDFEHQETKTMAHLQFYKKGTFDSHRFHTFRHYRLVLQSYAKPVAEFSDVKQLVQVIRDALQAHREAYDNACILHRNISPGCILIDEDGRGCLADWDLSRSTASEYKGTRDRCPEPTGTWQFIACRLVQRVQEGEQYPEHNRDDDNESFWLSFFWLAATQCEMHPSLAGNLFGHLSTMYDTKDEMDGFYTAAWAREQSLRNPFLISKFAPFKSQPLCSILDEFRAVVAQRYIVPPLLPANKKQFKAIWKATLNEFREKGEPPTPYELQKRYTVRLIEADLEFSVKDRLFARHFGRRRWPEEILERYLKPGETRNPINTVDLVSEVDWITGNANKKFTQTESSGHGGKMGSWPRHPETTH